MLGRFDREARAVLVASEAQAQADGSDEIAVHHLLLALASVPTTVAWTLATLGLDEARLRDVLDRCCGVPFPPTDRRVPLTPDAAQGRVPFAAEAKAVVAGSARVAEQRGRAKVGPADVALAVLGSAAVTTVGTALTELGVEPPAVARALR